MTHDSLASLWTATANHLWQSTLFAGLAALAALAFHPDARKDNGFWVLQLHGNGDSAFSPWQLTHCGALRAAGYSVLDIDYHGFGMTPGRQATNDRGICPMIPGFS